MSGERCDKPSPALSGTQSFSIPFLCSSTNIRLPHALVALTYFCWCFQVFSASPSDPAVPNAARSLSLQHFMLPNAMRDARCWWTPDSRSQGGIPSAVVVSPTHSAPDWSIGASTYPNVLCYSISREHPNDTHPRVLSNSVTLSSGRAVGRTQQATSQFRLVPFCECRAPEEERKESNETSVGFRASTKISATPIGHQTLVEAHSSWS
ncbi:hypothetical protein BCR34DRAFT_29806 [Clohesyomyces aquaticus]|uniref:Uncharacterized protein n=1 Tax=Clohesyomyces aquaticus TaxID=1231657 RepID=A0A1Y1ZA92_9PLEO|nr:hypothetical protein BCR34DRAFT_29806 [Clohesyomyces aquaticus]